MLSLHGRYINFVLMRHPDTHQQVMLLGDCHGKEQYANQNRAAIINTAQALNAQVIVEDMSDYSFFKKYLAPGTYDEIDHFTMHSIHSRKRLAYTSLSLVYHCTRKDVPVTNVEFRHGSGFGEYHFLSKQTYFQLLSRIIKSIDHATKACLLPKHQRCLDVIIPIIARCMQYDTYDVAIEPTYFDETVVGLGELDYAFCLMIDILMMQEIIRQTAQDKMRPMIVGAGAAHTEHIQTMLANMGYEITVQLTRESASMQELRLQPIFKKHVLEDAQQASVVNRASIGFHDRKRVYWSLTKKMCVSGAAVSALASMIYTYSRHIRW